MTEHQDEKLMQRAIQLSLENVEREGGPFAALVVRDGEIIAEGVNNVTLNNDPTAHAEINAIRIASRKLGTFDLSGCILYSSCEPCPMCLGAIYWARISRVCFGNTREDAQEYGFDDSQIYKQIDLPLDKREIQFKRLLAPQALQAFRNWEEKEDKTRY